jgi:signal transduction histidine kinase
MSAPATLAIRPASAGRQVPLLALRSVAGLMVLSGAAVALVLAHQPQDLATEVVFAALIVAWAAAAETLLASRPGERLGVIALGGSLLGALAVVADATLRAQTHGTSVDPTAASAARLALAMALALLPAVGTHLLLGVPDGACLVSRSVVGAGYALAAATGLALWTQRPDRPAWPIAVEAVVLLACGIVASNGRYQRAAGAERQRMQWFGWAGAVAVEMLLGALALRVLSGWPTRPLLVLAGATAPFALALALSGSRRLAGRVDRILAHTVSVAGLTGVVVSVYLVIVVGLGRSPTGHERPLLTLSLAAAAIAALLYGPARERLALYANRIAYGEREAPDAVLRTFGARLTRAIPMDELLLQVAESLRKTLVLSSAEVWTGSSGRLERTVSVPDAPVITINVSREEEGVVARAGVSGPAWIKVWLPALLAGREQSNIRVAPTTHSGRVLGLIVAVRQPDADSFAADDESMLTELARQLGLALHNVELDSALQASLDELRLKAEELQASRARIVAASDAARRQIERNLHDGAQQHLVALAVNVRLARKLAETDPAGSLELLDHLASDLQDAVQELRSLAHGIYPPLLVDRGLGEALRSASGRATIPTTVEADGLGRYSPEVEAAVYFCCLEALQNAGKHAGEGATGRVRVWADTDGLLFEVSDTGVGFDLAATSGRGAGFVNMSDRVGAIGGTVSVQSAPGQGTRISGRIPLR